MAIRGYLDIETTGLSRNYCDLTVVGVGFESGGVFECVQLVGDKIYPDALNKLFKKAPVFYTYNGKRFDLPFIKVKLQVDLTDYAGHEDLMYRCWKNDLYGGLKAVEKKLGHEDLMYRCWKNDLYGGLKAVEKKLGIERNTADVDGRMAVSLWYDYRNRNNKKALELLLKYNEEDVRNLVTLREKLESFAKG